MDRRWIEVCFGVESVRLSDGPDGDRNEGKKRIKDIA